MRKCSNSLIVREVQIKTTLRYHLIPSRLTKMTPKESDNVGGDVAKLGH